MGNMDHRSAIGNQSAFLRGALRHEHIIRSLRLTERVHHPAVKGIGMVSPLVVK